MLAAGTLLGNKYRLDLEIGRGGMGSVWRATRLDLGTEIAVKVMHGGASQKSDALNRFGREARAAAGLSSPHVVRIIDFGVDEAADHAFLAMELLIGQSLSQRLKQRGRLPSPAVAAFITQVGRALNQAHALGIVHRDLKPANIFLVKNEEEDLVKLLDFGIAKAEGGLDEALLTETGNVLGTPHYMSPEQLSSSKGVDHRTDLWSLGVIACECLTGRRPFRADSLGELAMRISLGRCDPPSSVGPVPVGFDAWFARATEVDPARRFQSAAELSAALQALVASGQSHERPRDARAELEPTLPSATLPSDASSLDPPASAARSLPAGAAQSPATLATLSTTNVSSFVSSSRRADAQAPKRPRAALRLALGAGLAAALIGAVAVLLSIKGLSPRGGDVALSVESNHPRSEATANAAVLSSVPEPAVAVAPPAEPPPSATLVSPASEVTSAAPGAPSSAGAKLGAVTRKSRVVVTRSKRGKKQAAGATRTRSGKSDNLDAYDWQ